MLEKFKHGSFTPFFIKQLNSLFSDLPHAKEFKFVLALPGNYRFPYLNKAFLLSELENALNIVCTSKVKILSIKANENDDHYIEISISLSK